MKKFISLIILLISFATIISGAMQVVAPAFVLEFIGAESTLSGRQLFATIGMFMVFFGGMMMHALYSSATNSAAIVWSAIQKFGAAVAVLIGIFHGVFDSIAAGVALFDLASGSLFVYYFYTREKV